EEKVLALFRLALGEAAVLHLRLRIEDSGLAALPWELLYDPVYRRFLATWPRTLLSRGSSLVELVRELRAPEPLRLLAIFPRSSGLDTQRERDELLRLERETRGRIAVRSLEGRATLSAFRDALRGEDIHLIHFAGHAVADGGDEGAALWLDREQGELPERFPAASLARLLEAQPNLRLVVLNACYGAALVGLAHELLKCGIPAVVGMQASIVNSQALKLTTELYRELACGREPGQIEQAVTRARSVLLQDHPHSPVFANPVLYLRAPTGSLWQEQSEGVREGWFRSLNESAGEVRVRFRPLPPQSFLGRDTDLLHVKRSLFPAESAEGRGRLLLMTGWPGVGKTTLTTALVHDPELQKTFPDGILWTGLDQSPSLLRELGVWCVSLGGPGLSPTATLEEASLQLAALLRRRRALLVIDDVWDPAHAVPFLVGGPQCAMLVTSRLPAIAHQLDVPSAATYRLPPLSDEAGLELLRTRAPEVVAARPDECLLLVQELEGLPLALHVAGRMLDEQSRWWDVGELLQELREGRRLLEESAPSDRTDFRRQTLPTVDVLLAKSTERLPAELFERFAFLGGFAPKPATFDLPALQAVWKVDDAKPTVRKLINLGLLEAVGEGKFWMHALLVAHARSLLGV
ncbi:MAG TPA: CHAT domain-containing protein, partial [Thermoanaerobaculia bacterium]|nr:CHAT domain-containing protein [Thermoanaerobaculia bacterium]